MIKKTKINDWKPVKLEGPLISGDLDGLIGIEELTDYKPSDLGKKNNRKRKNTESDQLKKKKIKKDDTSTPNKKKTDLPDHKPGAFVKSPKLSKAKRLDNQDNKAKKSKKSGKKNKSQKLVKKQKAEIGQVIKNDEQEKHTIEDLTAWSIVSLPEPLMQGLADLGFTRPTTIQELTLPPAIFGRRDILGAAETGSGKTLAFGLPILTGILKFKETQKEKDDEKNILSPDEENEDIESNNGDENEDLENSDEEEENEDLENSDEEEENEESDQQNDEDLEEEENEDDQQNEEENRAECIKEIDNIKFEDSEKSKPLKPLYALILTPTRELAVQIKNHLIAAAKHTDIKVAVVLGGMAQVKQERILRKGPEIVVATPGRLWELIQEGNPHLSQVDDIKYLAIDETDRMVEKFHFQELHQLLERINMDETKRKQRQNFVFSATLTMVHDLPRYLIKKKKIKNSKKIHKLTSAEKLENIVDMLGISNPKIVDVTEKSGTAKTLTECRINCDLEEKDNYVYYFLQRHPGRTLIFCNSIDCVRRVANLLTLLGCTSLPLHANMQQRQRLKNLEKFRDDPHGVLVATDVAARGLDIPSVEHVFHYQTPRTSESYVHRSGRTARASKEGITVLLIEPKEVNCYIKLCHTLGRTEDLPNFPILENYLTAVKQRVSIARKLEVLELQFKRTNAKTGWLQKAAKEMDIVLDEDEFCIEVDTEEISRKKRQISSVRQELKYLLAKPIFPKGFTVNYPTSSGQLNIPMVQGNQSVQKAVEVMKTHMKNISKKEKHQFKRIFNRTDAIKEKKQMKQEKKDSKKKIKISKNKN